MMGSHSQSSNQGLLYSLLSPLAVMAVLVWVLEGAWLNIVGGLFLFYSATLTLIIPRQLAAGWRPSFRWLAAVLMAAAVAYIGWKFALLPGLLVLIAALSLLRLWYLKQYHLQQGDAWSVELLRRGLLISLWSHASVIVALVNPY